MRHNEKEANVLLSEILNCQGNIVWRCHDAYFNCCFQNEPSFNVHIVIEQKIINYIIQSQRSMFFGL